MDEGRRQAHLVCQRVRRDTPGCVGRVCGEEAAQCRATRKRRVGIPAVGRAPGPVGKVRREVEAAIVGAAVLEVDQPQRAGARLEMQVRV